MREISPVSADVGISNKPLPLPLYIDAEIGPLTLSVDVISTDEVEINISLSPATSIDSKL